MQPNLDFLRVRGSEIVNERGEVVRLRGFCLGGWMNGDDHRYRDNPQRLPRTV